MKSGELAKRQENRDEAEKALERAQEVEDAEEAERMSKRLVKVTKQHAAECQATSHPDGRALASGAVEAEGAVRESWCAAAVACFAAPKTWTRLTFGVTGSVRAPANIRESQEDADSKSSDWTRRCRRMSMTQEQFVDTVHPAWLRLLRLGSRRRGEKGRWSFCESMAISTMCSSILDKDKYQTRTPNLFSLRLRTPDLSKTQTRSLGARGMQYQEARRYSLSGRLHLATPSAEVGRARRRRPLKFQLKSERNLTRQPSPQRAKRLLKLSRQQFRSALIRSSRIAARRPAVLLPAAQESEVRWPKLARPGRKK
uniref:40S ribosomal protein S6 n=1 Tax=Macrostomum lignano TaxID=282301 RepID=A0A1I8FC67_9PLAT